jgi:hypothetical protein
MACSAKGLEAVSSEARPKSNFLSVFGSGQEFTTTPKTTKGNNMVVKLEVFKTVHNAWPAKGTMSAGESYDLLCLDVSNPTEHRMEEMLYYRTKPEERELYFVNGAGKIIQVGVAKIRHADKSGKATIIGSIIPDAIKK